MSLFKKIFQRSNLVGSEDSSAQDASAAAGEDWEDESNEGQLAVDVYQDKDNIVIKSTIAGVKPEDLDITITNDQVTIRGERKQEQKISEEDYLFQECYWGAFSRSLTLPVEADVDKATADLRDGILTLVLPKASRAKTKKVRITQDE